MIEARDILIKAFEIQQELIDKGYSELEEWDIRLNTRYRTKAGTCKYKQKLIELSLDIFSNETNFYEGLRNTVLHECAHAIVGPGHKHNWTWRSLFLKIGGDGKTHHSYEVNRNCGDSPREAYCENCKKLIDIGPIRFKRLKNGNRKYWHKVCNGELTVPKAESKKQEQKPKKLLTPKVQKVDL